MAVQTEMFLEVEARKVYGGHNHKTVPKYRALADSYGISLKPGLYWMNDSSALVVQT